MVHHTMLISFSLLLLALLSASACDQSGGAAQAIPQREVQSGDELAIPVVQKNVMHRTYGIGGRPMRRGLVPFGERVLVVAQPIDDRTPQHIVVVDSIGTAEYLHENGTFVALPDRHQPLEKPAVLRGEGIEADYADGLLALLNSDSLSDWTDSGFLDWGEGEHPVGAPVQWNTRIPLVWRESHQRTVAVLEPSDGQHGTLVVGHVGRLFRDADGRQPVHFPSAMISVDRGRSWVWSPEWTGTRPPVGAYAAAWPSAPGGSVILYFVTLLPGDDETPPLAVFRPDATAESGVAMGVPYASRQELWADHIYESSNYSFAPDPIRHWVTRWGLILETITQGLFWMDTPEALPMQVGSAQQTLDTPGRTLYFSDGIDLLRVLDSGVVEQLQDIETATWTSVGQIDRPEGTVWLQAAASRQGTLWLLGRSESSTDVTIATWPAGTAY